METIEWSDQLGSRSRKAWLLLVKAGRVEEFAGRTIPGWCVVKGTRSKRDGKWSHTTYTIVLGDGVRAIPGRAGFETGSSAREGLGAATRKRIETWADFAGALGVDLAEARRFCAAWRPDAVEVFDRIDAELAELAGEQGVGQTLINLTPHPVVLRTEIGDVTVQPEPEPARVSSEPGDVIGWIGACPVHAAPTWGGVVGLPAPAQGVTYIVSAIVAARVSGRADVVSPGTGPADGAIRDGGRIVAVTRLIAAP